MNDFVSLNLGLLTENCQNETQKYLRKQPNEPGYCFELFCRACRDGILDAISHIYDIYMPLLTNKARKHPTFSSTARTEATFAKTALANFFLNTSGDKFLNMFSTLASTVAYLYSCLNSEIIEDYRKHRRERPPDPNMPTVYPDSTIEAYELWNRVEVLLQEDAQLQRLARLHYQLDMKVSEISASYPQIWATPREVSVALQRIRRKLRKDSILRDLANLTDDDTGGTDDS